MDSEDERTGPRPGSRPLNTTATSVTDWHAAERRRARRTLDQVLGIPDPPLVEIDYHACGLDLGWPERVAAAAALSERAA